MAGDVLVDDAYAPCEILLLADFTLKTREEEVTDYRSPMVQLPSGDLVTRSSVRERLSVWSPDGQPKRFVGRAGSGPNEFRYVAAIYRDAFDTIHVADIPGRWHVYDADLTYVRTNQQLLNEWNDTAFLEDGRVLVARNAGYPEGPLFFILDRDGHIIESFGRALHHNENRRIAYEGEGVFWTAQPTRYLLERRNLKGEVLATITRNVKWFPGSDAGRGWNPSTGEPNITRLILDRQRRLWVVTMDPAQGATPADYSELSDWVVEVFDTSSGVLMASARYETADGTPTGLLHDGRFYSLVGLPDHTYSARVGTYELVPHR